jgi:ABC-type amino acid transport substrate-binding protein
VLGCDEIVVGHDSNFVPLNTGIHETGEYVVFDIDLVAAIAEEAGFEYRTEPMAFDGLIPIDHG